MTFKSPDQAPGQLRVFLLDQPLFIFLREHLPIFTFFKKSNLQNDLNIPLHQNAAHRNFIINGFNFAEFCVTRAKLHFGEFSNLTFQAVSWSLLAGKAFFYFPKKHDLAKKRAVLAVSTGHILVLRCKTCALLRAKTSALLRRKTCAVLRARTCALLRANTKEAAFGRLHKGGRPSAAPLCGFLCKGLSMGTGPYIWAAWASLPHFYCGNV